MGQGRKGNGFNSKKEVADAFSFEWYMTFSTPFYPCYFVTVAHKSVVTSYKNAKGKYVVRCTLMIKISLKTRRVIRSDRDQKLVTAISFYPFGW